LKWNKNIFIFFEKSVYIYLIKAYILFIEVNLKHKKQRIGDKNENKHTCKRHSFDNNILQRHRTGKKRSGKEKQSGTR